jgi:hypothetical protein
MNASTIGIIALAGSLLAGCETLNGPQAYANAEAERVGCPGGVTVVTNTPEQMRLQNDPNAQTDAMKQSEGSLALVGVRKNEPPELRNRAAPEQSLTSKSVRGC